MSASDTQPAGSTFGPPAGSLYGGPGAVFGGSAESAYPATYPHGATFAAAGSATGATFGGVTGALYSVEKSPVELLRATDGWALVISAVPGLNQSLEHLLYTPSGNERDADGAFVSFSATLDAMAAGSLKATFVAESELFTFPFADFTLGYDGDCFLTGRFKNPSGDTDSQQVTVTGYGALDRLKSGNVDKQYSGLPAWQAIEDFYQTEIIPRTNGRIRGTVAPPVPIQGEREVMIPSSDPLELSGSPLSVLGELHGFGEMIWSVEHEPGDTLIQSHPAGAVIGRAVWEHETASPQLDAGDYHTDVIIHGAKKPGIGEQNVTGADRYYGAAHAPDAEVRTITGGERIVYETSKDSLESDAACQSFARTKLNELRGSYQFSGDLDVVPGISGDVVPGRAYHVPEFDDAAPPMLSPAVLPLRTVNLSHGAATADVSLSFGPDDDVIIGTLLDMVDAPLVVRGMNRLNDVQFGNNGESAAASSNPYPHDYSSGANRGGNP